jgi:hypothetical protein
MLSQGRLIWLQLVFRPTPDKLHLERVVVVTIDILVRSGQSVHRFHSLLFAQEDRSIPPPIRANDPTWTTYPS